jgi:hypothetical protein
MMKFIKDSLSTSLKGDMMAVNKEMPEIMNQMQNNPLLGMVSRMMTLVEVKK